MKKTLLLLSTATLLSNSAFCDTYECDPGCGYASCYQAAKYGTVLITGVAILAGMVAVVGSNCRSSSSHSH